MPVSAASPTSVPAVAEVHVNEECLLELVVATEAAAPHRATGSSSSCGGGVPAVTPPATAASAVAAMQALEGEAAE